jgi:hypothetical protein
MGFSLRPDEWKVKTKRFLRQMRSPARLRRIVELVEQILGSTFDDVASMTYTFLQNDVARSSGGGAEELYGLG